MNELRVQLTKILKCLCTKFGRAGVDVRNVLISSKNLSQEVCLYHSLRSGEGRRDCIFLVPTDWEFDDIFSGFHPDNCYNNTTLMMRSEIGSTMWESKTWSNILVNLAFKPAV